MQTSQPQFCFSLGTSRLVKLVSSSIIVYECTIARRISPVLRECSVYWKQGCAPQPQRARCDGFPKDAVAHLLEDLIIAVRRYITTVSGQSICKRFDLSSLVLHHVHIFSPSANPGIRQASPIVWFFHSDSTYEQWATATQQLLTARCLISLCQLTRMLRVSECVLDFYPEKIHGPDAKC